jgi:hypothetical protein
LKFGPHQVADPKDHQIDIFLASVSADLSSSFEEVVYKQVEIVQHQVSEYCVNFRGDNSGVGIATDMPFGLFFKAEILTDESVTIFH